MGTQLSATPFGRRAASLGQLATQAMVAKAIEEAGQPGANVPAAVNKWHLFRTLTALRERLGVSDRALAVLIALGLDEGLAGPWEDYRRWFMGLVMPLRQLKGLAAIEQIHADLATLLADITNTLNSNINAQNINGNDAQNKRHISNSKTNDFQNLEPSSDGDGADDRVLSENAEPPLEQKAANIQTDLPLALVIEACPDVTEYNYGGGKVTTWSGFQRAAEAVRPMIGISPDAWHEACRVLTDKARAGEFTPGPMLMALIGQRAKVRRATGKVGEFS
ncbi:MAG: replication initiation protein RepC [Beijerinckiaceae bacterium]